MQHLLAELLSHEEPLLVQLVEKRPDAIQSAVSLRRQKNAERPNRPDTECMSQTSCRPIVENDVGAKLQAKTKGLSFATTEPGSGDRG